MPIKDVRNILTMTGFLDVRGSRGSIMLLLVLCGTLVILLTVTIMGLSFML